MSFEIFDLLGDFLSGDGHRCVDEIGVERLEWLKMV